MKSSNRNIGIDMLKILSCVGVVILHFGGEGGGWAIFAVPIFMLVSIYLNGMTIRYGDMCKLMCRMRRLYTPFVVWGLISFVAMSIFENSFSVTDLLLQLTIGVPACPPLYFIFLLAINTLLLFFVARCGRYETIMLAACLVCCLMLQYTGLNHRIFAGLPFYPRHSLGRFAELLPAAVCGYSLFQANRKWWFAISGSLCFVFVMCYSDRLHCRGFSYQGLYLLSGAVVVSSIMISLGEYISKKLPEGVCICVGSIACLTPGVYYVHLLVGRLIEVIVGCHRSIWEAMLVLLLSAGFVFVMKRINRLAWIVS